MNVDCMDEFGDELAADDELAAGDSGRAETG